MLTVIIVCFDYLTDYTVHPLDLMVEKNVKKEPISYIGKKMPNKEMNTIAGGSCPSHKKGRTTQQCEYRQSNEIGRCNPNGIQ